MLFLTGDYLYATIYYNEGGLNIQVIWNEEF
jgi:hypothetical protein